jgi:ABC-type Na+ efflux pump permease subunit
MTPERTLRIARWEVTRSFDSVDRRTGILLLVLVIGLAALLPAIAVVDPSPGADLYRVGVDESNPYHEVVTEDARLRAVDPATATLGDTADVIVAGTTVLVADEPKSRAAAGTFQESIVAYNDRRMQLEADRAAAFPVTVTLRYVEQSALEVDDQSALNPSGGPTATATTQAPVEDGTEEEVTDSPSQTTAAAGDTTATGVPEHTETPQSTTASGTDPERTTVEDVTDDETDGPLAGLFSRGQTGTPSGITPPFPLESLLLAFAFLLPFNVVIQAYGSSVMAERIKRRGESLLVAPVSRGDIIVGKALPYFLGSILITAVIALLLGGSYRSVAAIAPLAGLFVAATFVAGLLARSYKELTFSTVTISVVLTAYAFLPAVFAEVHPIAAISPLTVVVHDLQGTAVSWGPFLLGTVPPALSATVLFTLGAGIYREEDLFTRRPLPQKTLDALAAPLHSTWHVGLWTALFVPFVLVAELMAVAALFVLPVSISVPLLLAALAIIEEVAKSLHVYAGYRRDRFAFDRRRAVAIGLSSGIGFFLAEKLLAITQLVGLPNLDLGRAAFGPAMLGLGSLVLLVAPLLLHTTTAAVSALGASHSRARYLLALILAVGIHLAYNLTVVSILG